MLSVNFVEQDFIPDALIVLTANGSAVIAAG
jgi:hypothetical protein